MFRVWGPCTLMILTWALRLRLGAEGTGFRGLGLRGGGGGGHFTWGGFMSF